MRVEMPSNPPRLTTMAWCLIGWKMNQLSMEHSGPYSALALLVLFHQFPLSCLCSAPFGEFEWDALRETIPGSEDITKESLAAVGTGGSADPLIDLVEQPLCARKRATKRSQVRCTPLTQETG